MYYLNVLQTLCEMLDDPNKEFVAIDEETMKKEARYCFKKLAIFLNYTYYEREGNTRRRIDPSKYKLIEYNPQGKTGKYKLAGSCGT